MRLRPPAATWRKRSIIAGLFEVETVEWLIHQQHGLLGQQTDCPDEPACKTFREGTHAPGAHRIEPDGTHDLAQLSCGASVDAGKEAEHAFHILIAVRPHAVGQIKDQVAPTAWLRIVPPDFTAVRGEDARYRFEQGGLAGAVGADHADHFARPDGEGSIKDRRTRAVALGQPDDLERPNVLLSERVWVHRLWPLLHHHPSGLQQRKSDQADDGGDRDQQRIADLPSE